MVQLNRIPVFCSKKKYYYHLSENYDRKFRKNGKPSDKYLYRCSVASWNFTLEGHESQPSRLGGGA